MNLAMDLSPMWISLKTALVSTVITFFVGIAAAWFVANYRGRLKGLIDGLLTLPLVLPPTVVGFFLLLLFGKHGPIGKVLSSLGTTIIFSWTATVIASTVVAFPLMYKTARGAFEQIDNNLLNAAGAVLAFARALGEFGATLMVAGNIPGKTQTIPLAIFFAAEVGEMSEALTWVLLIFGISLTVMVLMNYWNDYQSRVLSPLRRG